LLEKAGRRVRRSEGNESGIGIGQGEALKQALADIRILREVSD
jgi:hypothetical protein